MMNEVAVTETARIYLKAKKEMASTYTKNATKPNPSKILQLQTARKKINWTT